MKIYTKNEIYRNSRHEEFTRIMTHLIANGKLLTAPSTVERLYRVYSNEIHRTDWKAVDDKVLEAFSDWLSETEF